MKSTLFNMVAVLLGITFIASASVGLVNMVTAEPIRMAEENAKKAALEQVLPEFESTTNQTLELDNMPIVVYNATKGGESVGCAVETMTKSGFGGEVKLMVGFLPDGTINNISVLKQAETPGLGTNMANEESKNPLLKSVKNQKPESKKLVDGMLAVTKDGGDVDALTAATISSRAYLDAVNRAWAAFKSVQQGGEQPEVEEAQTEEPVAQEGEKNE